MNCNTPFIDLVVNRMLCRQLFQLGLTQKSTFTYRDFNDNTNGLFTSLFDPLNLYTDELLPKGVEQSYKEFPCYTFAEMVLLLPNGWAIENEGTQYVCRVPECYNLHPVTSTGYADAAALMVVQMLKAKAIDPVTSNYLIQLHL